MGFLNVTFKYSRPPNKNEIVVAKPFLCLFINVKWKTKFDYYKIISKLSSTNIHRRRRHRCHYVSFASEVKDAKLLKMKKKKIVVITCLISNSCLDVSRLEQS